MIGAVLDDLLAGARLNNQGHWSKALQCLLEQSSTAPGARLNKDEVIGAVLNDLLDGARLNNQGHWSKALQCLPEHSFTAPGAKLNRDDQSSAQ